MATRPKILIVEDDPIVASDIKHTVRDFGYEICGTAATADVAIAKARELQPTVVLMDITLEGKRDGIDAASSIQSELSIPVVYLTAHSDQATLDRAKLTHPYGYVLKPIREIELKIALEMALFAEARGNSGIKPVKTAQKLETAASGSITGQAQFIRQELLKYSLFSKVDGNLLNEISSRCSVKEYGALELISLEEESQGGSDGFLVLSGRVAMLKTSLNGRELVVQLVGPNNTFGLFGCLDSSSTELTSRAQIDSKLIHVPKTSMLYLLNLAPSLYPELLAEYSQRMHALHNMARSLAHDKVEVRVAATLVSLASNDSSAAGNPSSVDLKMSRQELANIAGTTVETAIRVTRAFEKAGILELPDHRVIRVLMLDKLKALASGAEE